VRTRPAGWDDLAAVAELLASHRRAGSGIGPIHATQLRGEWERPGFALRRDAFVAADRTAVIGYAAVSPSGELVLAAADDGIADALLDRVAERARESGHTALIAPVDSGEGAVARLVRRRPFELEREILVMWRPLGGFVEPPRFPRGVTVRTFDPGDAESVHELLDECYGAWDARYVPMAHQEWVSWMTGDSDFDAEVWWIAEHDGALAGCALYWSSGWLKDIAVAPSERGRRLGAALVQQGLFEFSERGLPRIGLKVDAANPTGAVQLYERLGFVTSSRETTWRLLL
jgi:ribosomal protein S18 acetylase RimI-like enzyme